MTRGSVLPQVQIEVIVLLFKAQFVHSGYQPAVVVLPLAAADDFTDLNTFTAFIAQKYAPQFRFDPLDETPLISLIRQPGLQHYAFFVDSLSGSCPWLEQAAAAVGSLAGREGSAWIFRAPSSVIALWDKMTGVCVLDQQRYLYHYDIQYFAMTCLQDTALNLYQRYYTADIIAKIAGTDGRLCLALARQELYIRPGKNK